MNAPRPALAMIDEHIESGITTMTVTLAWGEDAVTGSAAGPSDQNTHPRLVGEATLVAVEKISGGRLGLDLAGTATTDLGNALIAIAQVTLEGHSDSLIGTALIRENDPLSATAKAVLDAVNRRLAMEV